VPRLKGRTTKKVECEDRNNLPSEEFAMRWMDDVVDGTWHYNKAGRRLTSENQILLCMAREGCTWTTERL